MRVRPSDPTLLPALLAYLRERPDCVARLNGGEDIAVSLLGSRGWDEQVRELHHEVFAQVECTRCANCCKTIAPTLTEEDIRRIAAHLGMSEAAFRDAHVVSDPLDGDMMKAVPCVFLGEDGRCTIYEVRPTSCARYPFTDQEGFTRRVYLHAENTLTCPAVYHIVEGLREMRRFRRR